MTETTRRSFLVASAAALAVVPALVAPVDPIEAMAARYFQALREHEATFEEAARIMTPYKSPSPVWPGPTASREEADTWGEKFAASRKTQAAMPGYQEAVARVRAIEDGPGRRLIDERGDIVERISECVPTTKRAGEAMHAVLNDWFGDQGYEEADQVLSALKSVVRALPGSAI